MSNQSNGKQVYIIDHISKFFPQINQAMQRTFGFDLKKVKAACTGDMAAIQEMGERGRQGKLVQFMTPLIGEAAKEAIKGTVELNKTLLDVGIAGGRGAHQVDVMTNRALVGEQNYINLSIEGKQDGKNQLKLEQQRHNYALEYAKTTHEIAQHMTGVSNSVQIMDLLNKPALADLANHDSQVQSLAEHYATYGDIADPNLLSFSSYTLGKQQRQNMFQRLLRSFSGRGK